MKYIGRYKYGLGICLFFITLTGFIFRNYFLHNQVPFPSNLLVSFYEPWKSYSWEGYPSGPPNKPIGFDNLRIFYPLRSLVVDQIRAGQVPLWNPYSFSGNTLLATYQAAVFHPFSFLFFFLPQIEAWSIIVMFQPILASFFMYLFLRELKVSVKSSLFGALTFAFSLFLMVWWEESFMSGYSALVLPLALWSIEKLRKKVTAFPFLVLVFSLTFSILSGWFQMSLYVFLFCFFWVAAFVRQNKKATVFIFLGFILSVLLSGVHLFPGFEAYLYSSRGTTSGKFLFEDYLQPLYYIITFISPDFFGNPASYNYFGNGFYHEKALFIGLPAFFFVLYTYLFKNVFPAERFLKWVGVITLSLGLTLPTSWLFYYLKVPFLSVVLPTRIFFLTTFCFSVLAAYGLERYLEKGGRRKTAIVLLIIGAAFLMGWIFLLFIKVSGVEYKYFSTAVRNLLLPSLLFGVLSGLLIFRNVFKKSTYLFFLLILVLSVAYILYTSHKYLYFSDKNLTFPTIPVLESLQELSGHDRFWSIGTGYVDRNFATQYQLYSPEGYDSIYIRRYGELLFSAHNNGNFTPDIQRADANIQYADSLASLGKNKYSEKLLSLLGVKYFVLKKDNAENVKTTRSDFEKVWEDKIFIIYKSKKALPRVFLVKNYAVKSINREIIDIMYSDLTDLSKKVILEEDIIEQVDKGKELGEAQITSYTPNKITIKTSTTDSRILFLSDAHYPGWKAFIDGQDEKIYRANYAFRSVVVPSGKHTVDFVYKPLSFLLGLITTFIGVFILIIMSIVIKLSKKSKK